MDCTVHEPIKGQLINIQPKLIEVEVKLIKSKVKHSEGGKCEFEHLLKNTSTQKFIYELEKPFSFQLYLFWFYTK